MNSLAFTASPEVASALAAGKPVVALESTIISHGLPRPSNLQVAREVDRNLVNINDLSVQSATGAHQTSAASAELSRLAVDLNGLVARFRT